MNNRTSAKSKRRKRVGSQGTRKTVQREHKDRLFRLIFQDKEDLLDLYNAVNGTEYENADELEITTIEDVIYLSMKNDLSFMFGVVMNLYEHQSIAFMIADMATKVKAARELVYDAAVTKDAGGNSTLASSMAKYYASEICNEVAAKALQIHGGYGFVRGFKIERLYRDCRVFTIYEGTSQIQQIVISGQVLGQ